MILLYFIFGYLTYNPIQEYYERIENGAEVVSDKVKRVYKKLVSDLENKESEWEYDAKRANHAIEFVENFCKHSKGRLRRQTLSS